MDSRALVSAGWIFVAGVAGVAPVSSAAPAPRDIIPVFRVNGEPEDKYRTLIFTDYTADPGQELIGLSFSCTRSGPDSNGRVKTTSKTRFTIKPALGGTFLFAPGVLPAVSSLPYPDPNDPNNQCSGENRTDYDEGDFQNSQYQGCPRDPEDPQEFGQWFDPSDQQGDCPQPGRGGNFHFGKAQAGETSYIVFSDAITGSYRNASTGGNDVDFTNFAIHVYAMDGTRLWTKTFPGTNSGGRLEPVLSGVGDFLNDDGVDELRVARIADGASTAFKYSYYNIATGAQIGSTVTISVAAP